MHRTVASPDVTVCPLEGAEMPAVRGAIAVRLNLRGEFQQLHYAAAFP